MPATPVSLCQPATHIFPPRKRRENVDQYLSPTGFFWLLDFRPKVTFISVVMLTIGGRTVLVVLWTGGDASSDSFYIVGRLKLNHCVLSLIRTLSAVAGGLSRGTRQSSSDAIYSRIQACAGVACLHTDVCCHFMDSALYTRRYNNFRVSDIAIFVLKRDVKLQLTKYDNFHFSSLGCLFGETLLSFVHLR